MSIMEGCCNHVNMLDGVGMNGVLHPFRQFKLYKVYTNLVYWTGMDCTLY